MNLYNNEVMTCRISERNDLKLVVDTVKSLPDSRALLHSDQGFQYTTRTYARVLEDKGLVGSHSRRTNRYNNACIDHFFSPEDREIVFGEAKESRKC